jgi:hypothetical protein
MSASSDFPMAVRTTMPTSRDREYREWSEALRQKCLDIFMQAVADIEKILAHDAEATLPNRFTDMSVTAINAQARSRANKQKTLHQLATILATDALSNADNPQWNPFDLTAEIRAEQSSDMLRWLLDRPA